jgi:hypothetical protein
MASVVISDKSFIPSKIKSKGYPVTKLDDINNTELDILPNLRTSIASEILPFRVRFTNIGLLGATAGIPGIGLQIIGINNYIL